MNRTSIPQRRVAASGVMALALVGAGAALQPRSPLGESRQLLLVVTETWDSVAGTLQRFERSTTREAWNTLGPGVPVVVGRNGLAWGRGESRVPPVGPYTGPDQEGR